MEASMGIAGDSLVGVLRKDCNIATAIASMSSVFETTGFTPVSDAAKGSMVDRLLGSGPGNVIFRWNFQSTEISTPWSADGVVLGFLRGSSEVPPFSNFGVAGVPILILKTQFSMVPNFGEDEDLIPPGYARFCCEKGEWMRLLASRLFVSMGAELVTFGGDPFDYPRFFMCASKRLRARSSFFTEMSVAAKESGFEMYESPAVECYAGIEILCDDGRTYCPQGWGLEATRALRSSLLIAAEDVENIHQ